MKKRILSMVLAICLVLSLVPTMAFAESGKHTVTVNAGEGGQVSTNGTSWSNSVAVTVNDGETLNGKVQYKADEGYTFDGVIPSSKIVSVAAGYYHSVLLDEDGNVWTAGYNYYGQLGRNENTGTYNANPTFKQVTKGISGVKITAIAAGAYHTVLLDEDGNVWTAGWNYYGQLGRDRNAGYNDANSTFTQVTVGDGVKIKAIAAGYNHTVLLDEDGNVWTAGRNPDGQLGIGKEDDNANSTFTQVTVGGGVKIKAIAAGGNHTVLLDENGNVWTTGYNKYGQLGRETSSSSDSTFTQVTNGISGVKITAIAAGTYHTILLDENGNVWTAGYNSYGQLGRDENAGTTKPNPTFKQAAVNPDAITFEELLNTPIYNDPVFLVKFKDIQGPVITGLENNKTYCDAVEFEVSDNDGIASVKANDVELTATNGKYTIEKGAGTVTVVATDKAKNETTITVTVNDGHTYEWQEDNGQYWKKCKFCGDETAKKDIPTITIDGADAVCVTQDYKFGFTLPQGATDASYGYEFENKGNDGLPAIIENNELFGIVPVTEYEPSENGFKVYAGAKTADGFEFFVSKTVKIQNEHAGGVATCVELAICDTCGEHYGELDSTNHNLEKVPAKAATVTETGNEEYWHCKDCGKYFADENGENEIALADTVTQKLPPEIIEGKGQSVTEGEKKDLTFRSNAAFSDFIRARLDGKTLDEKDYTVKEGSTVVTLKADYVATLSAGEHTIGIVSTSGTATTAFTVNAKAVADNDTKSPQTGDNSHIALWIALLFVSVGLLTVTGVFGKRKNILKTKN